ncbi:hypothetical protein B2J88_46375 [Rhodococcus sp. SRB_17]|nr:hypothetical protein [Rhodococcus sp. SRB_17]
MTATLDHSTDRTPILGFESTVPRRLVHRRSVAEVFVTECISTEIQDTFVLGAQWPRAHTFYESVAGRHDTMLLAETLRQSAIYLAHTRYRVSLTSRFVMQRIQVKARTDLLLIGPYPSDVRIDATVSEILRSGNTLKQFTINLRFVIDGKIAGTGLGIANVMTPETYDRLRWKSRQPDGVGPAICKEPVEPHTVGRSRSADVVLSSHPRKGVWQLRTDTTHPILFDHPCDHVPGMSVLEAVRQGAHAATGNVEAAVDELDVTFSKFVELDEHTLVIVALGRDGHHSAVVTLEQDGRKVAVGSVLLSRPHSTP